MIWPPAAAIPVRLRGSKRTLFFNIVCNTNRLGEPKIWVVDEGEADSFEETQGPGGMRNPGILDLASFLNIRTLKSGWGNESTLYDWKSRQKMDGGEYMNEGSLAVTKFVLVSFRQTIVKTPKDTSHSGSISL